MSTYKRGQNGVKQIFHSQTQSKHDTLGLWVTDTTPVAQHKNLDVVMEQSHAVCLV